MLLWLYNSLRWSHHIVTCLNESVRCLQTFKCKEVFFTSGMSIHCWTLPGIWLLLNLPEYTSRFSCSKQIDSIELCISNIAAENSSLTCIKHEEKNECCIAKRGRSFQHLNDIDFVCSLLIIKLFFDNYDKCQQQVAYIFDYHWLLFILLQQTNTRNIHIAKQVTIILSAECKSQKCSHSFPY